MRQKFLAILALGSCAVLGPLPAVGGDKDTGAFRGTWRAVAGEVSGKKVPDEVVKTLQATFTFTGNRYTIEVQGKLYERGSFKIDARKAPKTIDLSCEEGKDKGKTQLGIYRIEGDTLTFALTVNSKERPSDFVSTETNNVQITVCRRLRQ
jgi:uncharacterized protein (TIGR03067 family)